MSTSPRTGRATVYTVADQAGVSVATVSRVLQEPHRVRDSTRAKVLRVVDELDYVPHGGARSLASRRHEAHGLVLPELGGPYYSELLLGYESVAAEAGHSVVLVLTEGKDDVDSAVRRLAGSVDGMALMGADQVLDDTLAAVRRQVPVIGLTGDTGRGLESFSTENEASAQQLTRHLLAHGRRKVAFVGTPTLAPDVLERWLGFVAAHDGAPVRPALPAQLEESEGRRIADDLRAEDRDIDALVCANDELALAVIHRLTQHGVRVPDDVAVVGWDDVMAARYIRPALSTVRQPVRELGAQAAQRMRGLISGRPGAATHHTLPTTVVIRESCGCPDPSLPTYPTS
ncbi:MAG: LacI family DNA-binding transcriptional regulator [Ornithinimicrobium sp.]